MITSFTHTLLDETIDFILENNKDSREVRYLEKDIENLMKRLSKRIKQQDVLLLLDINNNQVTGYLELLVDTPNNYTQILVHLSKDPYQDSLNRFFDYIKKNYQNYQLHYVLGDYNVESIEYMNNTDATHDGFETMMIIHKQSDQFTTNKNIIKYDQQYKNSFSNIHDNLNEDAYWTAELLITENKFEILFYIENNNLKGYSCISHYGNKEEEIYFIYGETDEIKQELYKEAINTGFKYAESIQVLLDIKENNEIPFLYSLGFNKKEAIITYYFKKL